MAEGASCHGGRETMQAAARAAGKSDALDRLMADYPRGPHDQPQSMCPAFGSLRAFLKDDPRFGPAVKRLRDSWALAVAPDRETGFAVVRPDEVESQAVWFATLADSWLYGDLVHADPVAREKAAGHTLNSRYSAAVLLYGQVAIHVVATLNLIRQARVGGLIDLAAETLSEPVTAKVPMRFPLVGFAQAEVGTPMQDMFDALDRAANPADGGQEK